MPIDVGRFIRLRGAVRETMNALQGGEKAAQGVAAPEAYERLRAEALAIVPGDKADEFGRLFPEWAGGKAGRVGIQAVPLAEQALAMLGQLAGPGGWTALSRRHDSRRRLRRMPPSGYARSGVLDSRAGVNRLRGEGPGHDGTVLRSYRSRRGCCRAAAGGMPERVFH